VVAPRAIEVPELRPILPEPAILKVFFLIELIGFNEALLGLIELLFCGFLVLLITLPALLAVFILISLPPTAPLPVALCPPPVA
jgi:hypothetical protein